MRWNQVLNVCLISLSGGLLGGRMGTSFVSAHESKIVVFEGYIVRNLVGITG